METNRLKAYEAAFKSFQEELKNAILSGEIPVTWEGSYNGSYLARGQFKVGKADCSISVAPRFICYHNPLLEGFLDDDLETVKAMVKIHTLSEKDKVRIKELQDEINKIRQNKI